VAFAVTRAGAIDKSRRVKADESITALLRDTGGTNASGGMKCGAPSNNFANSSRFSSP
jgi:hypothetical protein